MRHAGLDDVDAVRALYERLSPEDLQLRFFVAHAPRTNFLEQWLSVEDRGGVSLVAEVEDPGATPTTKVVGEACYAPLPDGDAEFGITVDPEWRGWLGPWLLDTLAEQGAARGVPNLQASVLVRNRKMLALLRHRGYAVIDHPDWSEVRLVIGTTGRTPSWPPKPSGPRILVEAPGGRWSGESTAREHGFDVRTCPGPDGPTPHCPVLEGRPCPLVEGADALVVALLPTIRAPTSSSPRTANATQS